MSRGLSSELPTRSVAAPPAGSNTLEAAAAAAVRRVQVVYYLCRNGQLEHPHFMELSILPSHHLRLKDVMDKLTALRGKAMPSLFSWSCKRSYKNGYVWNDLSENDVIHPADGGAEYVLKGSEIIHGGVSERLQQKQPQRSFPMRIQVEEEEEVVEEEEIESKSGRLQAGSPEPAGGGAVVNRCSRGVSTEEEHCRRCTRKHMELALDDGGPVQLGGRNSVLLQLISCGRPAPPARASAGGGGGRKSGGLHRGVLNRLAMNRAAMAPEEEEEARFVKEDKEYFSGSIIECITRSSRTTVSVPSPTAIKRSNSYNEERSSESNVGMGNGEDGKLEPKENYIPGRKKINTTSK